MEGAGEDAVVAHLALGEQVVTHEQHTDGLGPARGERRLETVHRAPREAHVGIAPLAGVDPVAVPLVGQAEPTRPGDAAVHADDADVRAVLDGVHAHEPEGTERAGVDARAAQRFDVLVGERGAEGVVEEEHAHPGARPRGDDLAEGVRHLSRLAEIELEGERLARGAQVVPETRIGLVAAGEQLHLVTGVERGARDELHRGAESGLRDRGGLAAAEALHVVHRRAAHGADQADEREDTDQQAGDQKGDIGE